MAPELVLPRICISSTGGGGGKTLLSLGLCRALSQREIKIKPFKKGPDYIDAAWLSRAAGEATGCLDPFFSDAKALRELFCAGMEGRQLGLIEGNRGLYDGLNESGICSTSQVCRILECPIILCIDCAKSTRTVAAILNGLMHFEPGLKFAGVVLNRVGSERHANSLQAAIKANTDLQILGILPRLADSPLPERHMGIASQGANLAEKIEEKLDSLGQFVSRHCDLEAILAAAQNVPSLSACQKKSASPPEKRCKIGVVRDEALWFYYQENLEALEAEGAEITFLSLFDSDSHNLAKWREVDGLYLGGGFPEDYPNQISASPCLELIRQMANQGKPVYAECGGLIILGASLQKDNQTWPMAGLFPCRAEWNSKPQGLGYVEALVTNPNPWYKAGEKLLGHEFHYSTIIPDQKTQQGALNLSRGTGIYANCGACHTDGLTMNNVWASYTHIFAPSNPDWAKTFVRLACEKSLA